MKEESHARGTSNDHSSANSSGILDGDRAKSTPA
jgi:hypothetical protein